MSGDRRMERMQSDIEDLRKVRVKVMNCGLRLSDVLE